MGFPTFRGNGRTEYYDSEDREHIPEILPEREYAKPTWRYMPDQYSGAYKVAPRSSRKASSYYSNSSDKTCHLLLLFDYLKILVIRITSPEGESGGLSRSLRSDDKTTDSRSY